MKFKTANRYLEFLARRNLFFSTTPKNNNRRFYVTSSDVQNQQQEQKINRFNNNKQRNRVGNEPNDGFPLRQQERRVYYDADHKLFVLDNDIKRFGRIDPNTLISYLSLLRPQDQITSPIALMLLNAAGTYMPMYTPARRIEMLNKIWEILKDHGLSFDISHYNSLLLLYLENDFEFSPIEILAKLEKENIEPNRVTFQRLIRRFAQMTDLDGVNNILEYMKSQDMPITEPICNTLLYANVKADNKSEIQAILDFMDKNGIEKTAETYVDMMKAYAENGDFHAVEKIINEQTEITFSDADILKLLYAFVKNGHRQYSKQLLKFARQSAGYIHEALNMSLKFNAIGYPQEAVEILTTVHRPQDNSGDSVDFGGALFQQAMDLNFSSERILDLCTLMKTKEVNRKSFESSYILAVHSGKKELSVSLMDACLASSDVTLRQQCFWPLVLMHSRDLNVDELRNVFATMMRNGFDVDISTLARWFWPFVDDSITLEKTAELFPDVDYSRFVTSRLVRALMYEDTRQIREILDKDNNNVRVDGDLLTYLMGYIKKSNDIESAVKMLEKMHLRFPVIRPSIAVDIFLRRCVYGLDEDQLIVLLKQLVEKRIPASHILFDKLENEKNKPPPEVLQYISKLVQNGQHVATLKLGGKIIPREEGNVSLEDIDLSDMKKFVAGTSNFVLSRILFLLGRTKQKEKILEFHDAMEERNILCVAPVYTPLYKFFIQENDVENALKFFTLAMKTRKSDFQINQASALDLLNLLSKNGRYKEVIDILVLITKPVRSSSANFATSEFSDPEDADGDYVVNDDELTAAAENAAGVGADRELYQSKQVDDAICEFLRRVFIGDATRCDSQTAKAIFQHFCECRLVEINAYHVNSVLDDLISEKQMDKAISIFENLTTFMKRSANSVKLIEALAEINDVTNLQKIYDLLTTCVGENSAAVKLAVSLANAKKLKEANRIMDAPLSKISSNLILRECKKFHGAGDVKSLESLLQITKKKYHQNTRDRLYYSLLNLYRKQNNCKSALSLWMQMQEENSTPSHEILTLISTILIENNQPVPFQHTHVQHQADEKNKIKTTSLARGLMAKLEEKSSEPKTAEKSASLNVKNF